MQTENRNIYKKPREIAGYSQERAAELLDISVESLRAYETGRRVPPGEVVVRMMDLYNWRACTQTMNTTQEHTSAGILRRKIGPGLRAWLMRSSTS